MANIYVRSTDGNDADNGSTWALAKALLTGASAIEAAGDTIFVSDNHAESVASATITLSGSNSSPVRILCANDAAEPPTALAETATVTITGTTFSITGTVYVYGIIFIFTTVSSSAMGFQTSAHGQTYEKCIFRVTGASTSTSLNFGGTGSGNHQVTELINCKFRLAGSSHSIGINRTVRIIGGSWETGGTVPGGIFNMGQGARGGQLLVDGFDFSNINTTTNLVQTMTEGSCRAVFRNVKLPASWTGLIVASGALKMGSRVELWNSDNADTNYRMWIEDYSGSIKQETTIVKSGGASDGTTTLSWKMASSANIAYPVLTLDSPEIYSKWIETVGSSVTATVEIVHDSQGSGTSSAFTDEEIFIDLYYLGTSGVPLSLLATDRKADVLATAADQASSSETWTTTGLTTPVKQKLSVTFTPQEKGVVFAVVRLAKASKTVYVNPVITLT